MNSDQSKKDFQKRTISDYQENSMKKQIYHLGLTRKLREEEIVSEYSEKNIWRLRLIE